LGKRLSQRLAKDIINQISSKAFGVGVADKPKAKRWYVEKYR
jgi:hypothetical protein